MTAVVCLVMIVATLVLSAGRHRASPPVRHQGRNRAGTAPLDDCSAGALKLATDHTAATANATGQPVGAVPLGSTAYPIPPYAVFVSPGGLDTAAGTLVAPVRSVQRAVDVAPSGATIVLRAGVYRERVDLPQSKALTIQPYPHETVWFSGSQEVPDWVADAGAWRHDGWTPRFDHEGLDPPLLIGADPRTGYPDMAFLDGQPLHQVASRADVVPGSFFVDESASQLFIGNNPQGHTIEASTLTEALNVQGPGSIVRGLGFMHYATSVSNGGAVRGWHSVQFENDVFTANAAAGLSLRGDDIVRRVTSTYNGQLGIHGYMAGGSLIEDSIASSNNTDRFNPESAAGGIKLTSSTNVTMRGNVAEDNYGHALWFDEGSDHATAVGNITRRNARGAGVMFELSDAAIIAGNISADNEAGLQAGESSHVEVWNNTLVNNAYAFSAYEDPRPPQPVDITIRNNILSAGPTSRDLLINADSTYRRTWRDMAWTSDHNAVYRRCTSVTGDVARLANGAAGTLTYRSVREEAKQNAQEQHSLSSDNATTDPYVSDPSHGNYRPPSASPVRGAGAPLPADIASALHLPANTAVDIGAPVR